MRLTSLSGQAVVRLKGLLAAALVGLLVAACSGAAPEIAPAEQPLAKETLDLLAKKGMSPSAPMFVRIFKEESELEVWKARDDGRYYHFKTYPICNWSGDLGPKQQQGDKQAPEGFYSISQQQLNPNSKYYLAFNLGYPNAYDRSLGRTGDAVMVHGSCKSAGCYAMTDALAEEIYGLARESFRGGQTSFDVHAFPFRMTNEKLARFKGHKWYPFWATLKQGYDAFETYRLPPPVAVCEHRYVVNAKATGRVDAAGPCPRFERPSITPFVPRANEQLADERLTIKGPKSRDANEVAAATALASATTSPADGAQAFGTAPGLGNNGSYGALPPGASALGYNP